MGICETKNNLGQGGIPPFNPPNESSKSLCEIITQNQTRYTGFLIKLLKDNQDFFCLMTIGRFLPKILKENPKIVTAFYNNRQSQIQLNFDDERFNKEFRFIDSDIGVIEILSKDNIQEGYFLSTDHNNLSSLKALINKEIIIGPYNGTIQQINTNNEFSILGINAAISEGSPIFLKGGDKGDKVIGVYKGNNCGIFIGPVFDYLKNYDDMGNDTKDECLFGNPNGNMEIIMTATFETLEQEVVESIITMSSELFSKVLDKFYAKHEDYVNKNCIFLHEAQVMNSNLTMAQNNCKSANITIKIAFEQQRD